MKKFCLFLLAILTVLALLSGCNTDAPADGTAEDSSTPESDVPGILIAGEGAPEYVVVRPDNPKAEETSAAVLVRKYLEKCGVKTKISTDWEKNPVSDYEIVVGDTLRADTDEGMTLDFHDMGETGFFVKVSGSRIYLCGGTPAATVKAAEYFLTEFFGYSGNVDEASPVTSVSVPADYEYIERQSYDISSISVAGKDLKEFRLIWDDTLLEHQAKQYLEKIQTYFYKTAGVWLEIDREKTGTGPAIIFSGSYQKESGKMSVSVKDGNLFVHLEPLAGFDRGFTNFTGKYFDSAKGDVKLDASFKYEYDVMGPVTYLEFGAKGDGETNDIAAIIAAHEFANTYDLPVKADAGKTFYIGLASAGAVIKTDTDFTGAKFIIDDREVPDNQRGVSIFNVMATKPAYNYKIQGTMSLKQAQENIGITLPEKSVIVLTEAGTKRYIRKGANANNGSDQTELIVVDKNGNVDPAAPIIWDYKGVTSAQVIPMDEKTLTIKGGTFTTIASNFVEKSGYYTRGFKINRSNVVFDGVTHYVENEGKDGAPYSSFLSIQSCANITVQNCIFTPHITFYRMVDGARKSQGTYDITPVRVVNLTFKNCKQSIDIMDEKYWGIMGSNFCKNITLDGCSFSRFDAHQGVANATILNCELGWTGLNAIGFGTLRVENTVSHGATFINLRNDYGSTWQGDVIIRNCTWQPNRGKNLTTGTYALIGGSNTEDHEFGYQCYMPENITIENLHIDDSKALTSYNGIYIFANLNSRRTSEAFEASAKYPYIVTKNLTISGFTSVTGKKWMLSPNMFMFRNVVVNDLDKKP